MVEEIFLLNGIFNTAMDVPSFRQSVTLYNASLSASVAVNETVRLSEVRLLPEVLLRTTLLTEGIALIIVRLLLKTVVESLYVSVDVTATAQLSPRTVSLLTRTLTERLLNPARYI